MIDDRESPVNYIFGGLDQPQNAGKWVKTILSGVHHFSQKVPASPKPGESVTLKVTTSTDAAIECVKIWFSTDEWQTVQSQPFSKGQLVWDSIAWSYIQKWQLALPPQAEGAMLRYKIGAKLLGSDDVIYADNQTKIFADASHYSIWYGRSDTPEWTKQALVYQVFVDRFHPGESNEWQQTADLRKPFGGTIRGVIEKLPYIRDLGFNTIWLTPIFESPSHHGYDISDYFQINPRLGTLEEFNLLISEAHRSGIKIILDFVANHCSNQHPYFLNALEKEKSKYHDWFLWENWPIYECFFNVKSMPKLNLAYGSPARGHLLKAAQYWLEKGVDGYRLDYAFGPEHDFWVDFRRVCTSVNPEVWTFGELVLPADIQATYGDGLGGTLDFLLCQALRCTFGTNDWNLSEFAGFLNSHYYYFKPGHSLPSFVDNHDMDRFYTITGDDLKRLKLALLVLYLLPGPPIIYYGTETPLSQRQLIHAGGGLGFDEARLEMDWTRSGAPILKDYLKQLAGIRNNLILDSSYQWKILHINENEQILALQMRSENVLLVINRSDTEHSLSLPISKDKGTYQNLLTGTLHPFTEKRLTITIPSMSGVTLAIEKTE